MNTIDLSGEQGRHNHQYIFWYTIQYGVRVNHLVFIEKVIPTVSLHFTQKHRGYNPPLFSRLHYHCVTTL